MVRKQIRPWFRLWPTGRNVVLRAHGPLLAAQRHPRPGLGQLRIFEPYFTSGEIKLFARGRRRSGSRGCLFSRSTGWRIRQVDRRAIDVTMSSFGRTTWVIGNFAVTAIRHNTNLWSRFSTLSARWRLWRSRKVGKDGFPLIVLSCWGNGAFVIMMSSVHGDEDGIYGFKPNKVPMVSGPPRQTDILAPSAVTLYQ